MLDCLTSKACARLSSLNVGSWAFFHFALQPSHPSQWHCKCPKGRHCLIKHPLLWGIYVACRHTDTHTCTRTHAHVHKRFSKYCHGHFPVYENYSIRSTWVTRLRVWLLVSPQITISGPWTRAPRRVAQWAGESAGGSVSVSLWPFQLCAHSLAALK